jgi:hypothetical protein
MFHLRGVATLLALVAAGLPGCGGAERAIKALAEEHRPAIERNLAAFPAIAKQLRNMPPLSKDGIEGQHDLTVDAFVGHAAAASAALCYAEDLADPDELGYVWGRLEDTGGLNQCASLLHRGHAAYDPARSDRPLKGVSLAETRWRYPRCAGYRYLVVIRTLEFVKPTSATRATGLFAPVQKTPVTPALPPPKPRTRAKRGVWRRSSETASDTDAVPTLRMLSPEEKTDSRWLTRYRFEGGFLRAELLVFSLPSAKLLGGFRLEAQNHLEVQGTDPEIREDFEHAIHDAVATVLDRARSAGQRKDGEN